MIILNLSFLFTLRSLKYSKTWFLRYGKILETWKQAKPRPQTDEEAARLVITTLKGHKKADVEVLVMFQSCKYTTHFVKIIEILFC